MAPGHPQSDHQAVRDHPAGHGHTGRHPPSPLALPAPGNRRLERTSTPLHLSAPRACLSRMPRRVARTDLRGPRCSNASGLPGGRSVPTGVEPYRAERFLAAYHAELIPSGVGQDSPGLRAGSPMSTRRRPQREQPSILLLRGPARRRVRSRCTRSLPSLDRTSHPHLTAGEEGVDSDRMMLAATNGGFRGRVSVQPSTSRGTAEPCSWVRRWRVPAGKLAPLAWGMITCARLEYVIVPAKIDAFERFARRWIELVGFLWRHSTTATSCRPRVPAIRPWRCSASQASLPMSNFRNRANGMADDR